jgi:geranylgeranyl diphosphate synthase type II
MNKELRAFFDRVVPAVDRALDSLLPPETATPSEIHQAMRYSIFAGGKRLRPVLCVAGYSLGLDDPEDWTPILPVAAAFEMVHTYSLIHDDLPAMDDDDFRRGRLSCHRKFNEAIAILAGDALLTRAFEILSRCDAFPPNRMLRVISVFSHALGTEGGMIAGQVLDLEGERRPATEVNIELIHRSKTAALISAAVTTGAFLGGLADARLAQVRNFGDQVGLAFQIVDDILDEISTTAEEDERQGSRPAEGDLSGVLWTRQIPRTRSDVNGRVARRPASPR